MSVISHLPYISFVGVISDLALFQNNLFFIIFQLDDALNDYYGDDYGSNEKNDETFEQKNEDTEQINDAVDDDDDAMMHSAPKGEEAKIYKSNISVVEKPMQKQINIARINESVDFQEGAPLSKKILNIIIYVCISILAILICFCICKWKCCGYGGTPTGFYSGPPC